MLEIKKENLLINVFPNINDLVSWCKKTPRRSTADKSSESRSDTSWYGTKTLEEAYDKLLHTDDELYKKMKEKSREIKIEKILGNTYSRNKPFNDVVGFQADVPVYLKGIPQNMINVKPVRRSQKIINICFNISVSCGITREEVEEAGIVYANVIDVLEKAGYRCNLYILSAVDYNSENSYCFVKVKTDREPFNMKKLCFMFGNVGYNRRIMFKWIESSNMSEEPCNGAYGRPLTDKDKIKLVLKKYMKSDFIVWGIQHNRKAKIEDVLKDLKESGISLED